MWGRTQLKQKTGRPVRVCAGGYPEVLAIGVTVAWELVDAETTDITLDDDTPVFAGEKYIRYGTVMVPVTTSEVQTVDLSGGDDPNGGTWDMTILGETVSDLAWDVSAATLQTSIRALAADHADEVMVTKSGFIYTITFSDDQGDVDEITVDSTGLTSAGTVTVTVTTGTPGVDYSAKWAPFDSSQSDGRQTLSRSRVGIVDYTIKESENSVVGGATNDTKLIGLITGDLVYQPRLAVGGTNQPTLADLLVALPRLELAPLV